jgi:hypothetical protein
VHLSQRDGINQIDVHDIQILMAVGKLTPLGDPAPNAPKWFAAPASGSPHGGADRLGAQFPALRDSDAGDASPSQTDRQPRPNATKHFHAKEILELAGEKAWLTKATNALYHFRFNKNYRQKSRESSHVVPLNTTASR